MKTKIALIILAVLCGSIFSFSSTARAALSPLSISLVPPLQFPPESFDVTGLRVSALYGEHRSVYGFDFGVIGNVSELNFAGLAVAGGFNKTGGNAHVIGL